MKMSIQAFASHIAQYGAPGSFGFGCQGALSHVHWVEKIMFGGRWTTPAPKIGFWVLDIDCTIIFCNISLNGYLFLTFVP